MEDITYLFYIALYFIICTVIPALIIVNIFISTKNMDMFLNKYTEIVKKCDDLLVLNLKKKNSFIKHNHYRTLASRLVKKNIPKKATYDILKPFKIIPALTNIQVCSFDSEKEKYIMDTMLWYYSVMLEQPLFNRFKINYYNLDIKRRTYVDKRVEIMGYILLRELLKSDTLYEYEQIKEIIIKYYNKIFTYAKNIDEIKENIQKEIKNIPSYLIENIEEEIKTDEKMFFEFSPKTEVSLRQKKAKRGLLYPKL